MNYLSKLLGSILLISLFFCFIFCSKRATIQHTMQYPKLKSDPVSDTYFGKTIVDKYRILENGDNKAVQDWIKEERNFYDSISKEIPQRDSIQAKLENVMYSSNIRGGHSRLVGKKIFFLRNFIKEKTAVLMYKPDIESEEIALFTTKTLNQSNKIYNIDYFEPSFDGKYIAFGISSNGDEMAVIKIIDVESKELLPESIERANYATPFWIAGSNGFFYSQLKKINSDEDSKTKYEEGKVKLHWIGDDPENDKEVFSRNLNKSLKLDKIDIPFICTFPNSDKALAFTFHGSTQYLSLYYCSLKDLTPKANVIPMWKKACNSEDKVTAFALKDDQLFILSFKDNPNGALKKLTLGQKTSEALTLLNGKTEVLEDIIQTPNCIYLKELKNGNSSVVSINLLTNVIDTVKLPFSGYVYLRPPFGAPPVYNNSTYLFFGMESWNREFGVYSYNQETKQVIKTNLRAPGKYGNPNDIIVKDIEIASHDGTMVPLTIIYSKNLKLSGEAPTLLEGYGTYGVSMNATFNFPLQVWLKLGGIYAVAHVRGGGEKGDEWYKGGYKATKSNSWKDFIACAEYLIKNKYTSPKYLAAKGVSAGGITAGKAITERPELFKAAILDVSPLNSLRSENTSNSLSVSEYGTVKDSLEFRYILDMDVYHHIKDKIKYPSLLITAGLRDARVDWWQPAKAVARFQEVSEDNGNIVLFKISDEGHFGVSDLIRAATDEYSFLLWQLEQTGSE
jgi:prolyl oligopeptidase